MSFKQLKVLINKIFFGFAFAFASWKGLDGLFINYHSRALHEIDIAEFERLGAGNHRYLKVNNGIALRSYVYYKVASNAAVDVVYPIVSQAQLKSLEAGKPIRTSLLVQLSNQSNYSDDETHFISDSSSVIGLTKVGMEGLSEEDYKQLENEQLTVDKNAVLMELGGKSLDIKWNVLLFVVGTIFSFTLLKSFFIKATSLKEYWDKVTEKNES